MVRRNDSNCPQHRNEFLESNNIEHTLTRNISSCQIWYKNLCLLLSIFNLVHKPVYFHSQATGLNFINCPPAELNRGHFQSDSSFYQVSSFPVVLRQRCMLAEGRFLMKLCVSQSMQNCSVENGTQSLCGLLWPLHGPGKYYSFRMIKLLCGTIE